MIEIGLFSPAQAVYHPSWGLTNPLTPEGRTRRVLVETNPEGVRNRVREGCQME